MHKPKPKPPYRLPKPPTVCPRCRNAGVVARKAAPPALCRCRLGRIVAALALLYPDLGRVLTLTGDDARTEVMVWMSYHHPRFFQLYALAPVAR